MNAHYLPRHIDAVLGSALRASGAVVIEGARGSGKTMTALNAAESHVFLDTTEARQMLDIAPDALLAGERPRLLDEWQLAPELWNLVRRDVDRTGVGGQFILTGSALPADDVSRHSGAGRFIRIRERTMTWSEIEPPARGVSLAALFGGSAPAPDSETSDFSATVERLARSGFPAILDRAEADRRLMLNAYLEEIVRTDVGRLSQLRHEPATLRALLRAIARNSAAEVTYANLRRDLIATSPSIAVETVASYVQLLERLYVVERQHPWTPALRSRARLRQSPKLHLADAGLAAASLGASPDALARDPETVGFLFESQSFHDLSVLVGTIGGEVRHLRDSNGNEIDAVLILDDGRWAAVEVKVGARQIPAGAESLARAVSQIDTDLVGEPSFRLVVTALGGTFSLADGTITAPLHRLIP